VSERATGHLGAEVVRLPVLDELFDGFAVGEFFIQYFAGQAGNSLSLAKRSEYELSYRKFSSIRDCKSAGSNRAKRNRSSRRMTRSCTLTQKAGPQKRK